MESDCLGSCPGSITYGCMALDKLLDVFMALCGPLFPLYLLQVNKMGIITTVTCFIGLLQEFHQLVKIYQELKHMVN